MGARGQLGPVPRCSGAVGEPGSPRTQGAQGRCLEAERVYSLRSQVGNAGLQGPPRSAKGRQ